MMEKETLNKLRNLAEARLGSVQEAINQLHQQRAEIEQRIGQLTEEFNDGLAALTEYDQSEEDNEEKVDG